jgi:H+/gluconate symporter-like permease
MVVAHWTLVLVISLLPPEVQHTITFSISGTVILFGIGLTFATGLLFGLFPALTARGRTSSRRSRTRRPAVRRERRRRASGLLLATSQIALAMMLLASSGFFVKSLLNVSRVDLGFKIDHVATFGPVARPERLLVRPHLVLFSAPRRRASGSAGRDGVRISKRAASGWD